MSEPKPNQRYFGHSLMFQCKRCGLWWLILHESGSCSCCEHRVEPLEPDYECVVTVSARRDSACRHREGAVVGFRIRGTEMSTTEGGTGEWVE